MNKTYYPVKILLDEYKKPFIPFVTSNAILLPEGEGTIQDALDDRYTKAEVDAIIRNLGTLQRLCGRVNTKEDLPEDAEPGDTYIVGTAGTNASEYMYIGDDWEELGPMIDLSAYHTADEVDSLIAAVNANITTATNTINNKLKDYVRTVGGRGPDATGNVDVDFSKYDSLVNYLTYGYLNSNWLPIYDYNDIRNGNAYFMPSPSNCKFLGCQIPNTTNYNEYHLINSAKENMLNIITTEDTDRLIVHAMLPWNEMEYCSFDLNTGKFFREEMSEDPMGEPTRVDSPLNNYTKYDKATRVILFDYDMFKYSWGQELCAQAGNTDNVPVYYYATSSTLPTDYTFLGDKLSKLDGNLVRYINWQAPDISGNINITIPEVDLTKYDAIDKYLTDGAIEETPIIFNNTTLWNTDWAEGEYTVLPENAHYLKLKHSSGAEVNTKLDGHYRETTIAQAPVLQPNNPDYITMQVVNPENYDDNISSPYVYNPETNYFETEFPLEDYPYMTLYDRLAYKNEDGDIIIDLDEYARIVNGGFKRIVVNATSDTTAYYLTAAVSPTKYEFLGSYLEKVDELYEDKSESNTANVYLWDGVCDENALIIFNKCYQHYLNSEPYILLMHNNKYSSYTTNLGYILVNISFSNKQAYCGVNISVPSNNSGTGLIVAGISNTYNLTITDEGVTKITIAGAGNSYFRCNILPAYEYNTNPYNTYVLSTTNSKSYTPTGNYHPATKKYVDDAINSLITRIEALENVE